MPHPNKFAKNGFTKPKNPLGELISDQMSQPRPSLSSSSSPVKRTFKTNQNPREIQHHKPAKQTQPIDYLPAGPKNAGKRRSNSKGDDRISSKKHKGELSDSKISELKSRMKKNWAKGNAESAHAKPKNLIEFPQPNSLKVVPPDERTVKAEPSPRKPVTKIKTRVRGTQTQVVTTTTVTVQTDTERNGPTDSSSDFDAQREILHEKFQMLIKQFEIYALKRFEDRGIPAEEMNPHVSSLLEAFKLDGGDSSLMAHVWNFMEAIEGTRNSHKFLLDKCKEISTTNVMEFVKTHTISWEDTQWVQLSHAVNSPWSYADPTAQAAPPVIIKQEPAENSVDQRDCNFENFDDDTMSTHDFIPACTIKEERPDGIILDYQHGCTTLSFNST